MLAFWHSGIAHHLSSCACGPVVDMKLLQGDGDGWTLQPAGTCALQTAEVWGVSVLLQSGAPKSYLAAICHSCCCVKGQQVQKEHCYTHQQQQSRIFLQDTLQSELCSLPERIAAHSAVPASVKPQQITSASFCLMASFIWACSQHWNISAGSGGTRVCPAWSCRYNFCG